MHGAAGFETVHSTQWPSLMRAVVVSAVDSRPCRLCARLACMRGACAHGCVCAHVFLFFPDPGILCIQVRHIFMPVAVTVL